MAVEEVHRRDGFVDKLADRSAVADYLAIALDLLLLLGESAEGQPEAAHPALGCVDLGAGTGDCNPQGRMRLLVGLGNDGPLGHRPRSSLVREAFLGPHLGQTMDELVPGFLGLVGVGAKAGQFRPGCGAAGADVETAAGKNIEDGGALGDFDRMIELGHAHDDAVTDAHFFGLHRARGQEQLGGRAMRIFFEEVMLDGPDGIEAELIGQRDLLEAVVVDGFFRFAAPWPRYGDFIEEAKFHCFTCCTSFVYRKAGDIESPASGRLQAAPEWRSRPMRSRPSRMTMAAKSI